MRRIPVTALMPSPTNPRKIFNATRLAELAESMKGNIGQLQPLVVRELPTEKLPLDIIESGHNVGFEIVAGERRYRAAMLAGLTELDCTVKALTDRDVLEAQVIENNQREDVHPLEEADGFARILALPEYKDAGKPVEVLAEKLGKSTKYVYDRIKLSNLTEEAKEEFLAGFMTAGHAILIARLTQEDQYEVITNMFYETKWNGLEYSRDERLPEEDRESWSVRYLAKEIRYKSRPLTGAPFDVGDAQLLPMAGACSSCPKFEPDGSLCLDVKCYDRKCIANRNQVEAAVRAAGLEPVLLSNRSRTNEATIYGTGEIIPATEETPGAVPGIHEVTGQLSWVVPQSKEREQDKRTPEQIEADRAERAKQAERQSAERKLKWTTELKARAEAVPHIVSGIPVDSITFMNHRVLRAVIASLAMRDRQSSMRTLLGRFGFVEPKQYDVYPRALRDWVSGIETNSDLLKILIHVLTLHECDVKEWNTPEAPALEIFAEMCDVDLDFIRKEARDRLLAKAPKKSKAAA